MISTGRAALVLGGADGIGYAVADELGVSGAAVTVADLSAAALERASLKLGVHAHGFWHTSPPQGSVRC